MSRKTFILPLFCLLFLTLSVYGQLGHIDQFRFIENKGQWHPQAIYVSPIPDGSIILAQSAIYYHFYNGAQKKELLHKSHGHNAIHDDHEASIDEHTFKMSFLGGTNTANITPEEVLTEKRNYLKGNDPSKWASSVSAATKVKYSNVYEGIDFSIQEKQAEVKYEFIVHPGSKPKVIQLNYEGVNSIQILNEQLIIQTSLGNVIDDKPFAYQMIGDQRVIVPCEYQLEGNILSYKIGKYNKKKDLIIDPKLIFSTSSGSFADNWGNTACFDRSGNLYTGGTLFETASGTFGTPLPFGFPTSLGAVQNRFQGGDTDMAIMKFDSSGTFLHYSTIIGGNDAEIPTSTVVNENNELYILGTTASSDFPVTPGAFDTEFDGNYSEIVWYVNGVPVDTGNTFTPPTPLAYDDQVQAILESGFSCEQDKLKSSNIINITRPSSPNVSIEASSEAFCPGDAITFTATVNNGSASTFSWLVNGTAVAAGNPFVLPAPNDGDEIQVVVTDNSCGASSSVDTSNMITLFNANGQTPTLSITTDDLPLCSGETHTFKPSINFGALTTSYNWKINDVITSTEDSLVVTNLNNGDLVYLDVRSSLACLTADSIRSDTLIVDNLAGTKPLSISIVPEPYSTCDTMVTVNAEVSGAGTSPFIRWFINNGSFYVNIDGGINDFEFQYQRQYGQLRPIYAEVFTSSGCSDVPNTQTLAFILPDSDLSSADFSIEESTNDACGVPQSFTANVEGATSSRDYLPVGGYKFRNGTDIVVIRLSEDGTTILNSTYVGGKGNDGILETSSPLTNNYGDQLRGDVNLDSLGNVYVASITSSADFPTANPFQGTYGGGGSDAVAFKMDPTLSTMIFSTYIGGSDHDGSYSIQTNDAREVYVAGGTSSNDFPTTAGALQTAPQGDVDGFALKLSPAGSALTHSTRLGTNQFDQAYFIQVDTTGSPYVLGQTKGSYPVFNSRYSNPNSGLFLHKLSRDFSASEYSTVLGDENSTDPIIPNISPTAFLVNECQNVFISGWGGAVNSATSRNTIGGVTYSTAPYNGGNTFNMPLTDNAFQTTTDGSDFYLMALLKGADSLIYSTYFGGNQSEEHVDGGTSRFDYRGIVYQSVCANCQGFRDFPTFPDDGSQVTYPKRSESDNCNNGVFKFDLATLEADFEHDEFCEPNTITFANLTDGGIDFEWYFGDGDTAFTPRPDTVTHTYPFSGTFTVTLIATDLTTCVGRDTVTKEIFVPEYFTANHQYDTVCVNEPIEIEILDYDEDFKYKWEPSAQLNNDTLHNPIFSADSTIQYLITVTDTNGCTKVDTFDIEVRPRLEASFEFADNCEFQTIELVNTSTNGKLYEWRISGFEPYITLNKDTIRRILPSGVYIINLFAYNDTTCNKSDFADSQTIRINDTLSVAGDTLMCRYEIAHPRVVTGNNPVWEPAPALSCYDCPNPEATPLTTTEYIVSIEDGDCIDTDTVLVEIIPDSLPIAVIEVDPPRCHTDTVEFEGLIERNDCECCEEIQSWLWTFDDGTTSTEPNPKKIYDTEGVYSISLELIARDTVTTTTLIALLPADSCIKNIYIPNAFTPNNDGENDILYVRAVGIISLEFHLYSRWGEEVFSTESRSIGWDGIYKGAVMSPQVFTYTCKATFWDGEEFYQEGNVTLLE